MSIPSAPDAPGPDPRLTPPARPGTVSDPDVPDSPGPDTPDVRDDDPKGVPRAPRPSPPEDDDFAPDEA